MTKRNCIGGLLVLSAVVLALGARTGREAAHWPSFRGPAFTGVAAGGDPPLRWSETENVRWKVKLPGPGHASPVVWGDRIFVLSAVATDKTARGPEASTAMPASWTQEQQRQQETEQQRSRGRRPPPEPPSNVHRFVVGAYDRASGRNLWETVVHEEIPHEAGHSTASQASASPVTDGKRVYAFFGSRGLFCLDMKGKVLWKKDFGEMTTRNAFGEGASPVVHGHTLVIQWDHEGDSFIVALDKKSGEELWRVPRDEPTSWSTPLVVQDDDRTIVVASGANFVRGYDLATGEEVWACGGLGPNCVPVPVADAETLFVMSGWREAAGLGIRYRGAKGDISDSERVAWRIAEGLSYVPSPVLYDGQLYFLERFKGMLSSYDLKSGKPVYTQQRIEGVGNVYASLVAAAGRVYILDRNGTAVVFRHGRSFELLATNKLDDGFDATPVIVGKTMYLRGHEHLYALEATR